MSKTAMLRNGAPWPVRWGLLNPWTWFSLSVMAVVLVPLLFIAIALLPGDDEMGVWAHIREYRLSEYVQTSILLCLGVSLIAGCIGVSTAWLVSMCSFPGRRVWEWALLLPLAVPAYIMAYTYTDLLDYGGPVQSALRSWFAWEHPDEYWFPAIRSLGGAMVMLGLVLYPYVYLTCRTAFLDQSVCVLEAGRTLGHGPWSCFWRIALPLARPAMVAGLALVMMETLADYGTVDYFAVDTLTLGIYRTYTNLESYAAASKLAAILLVVVAIVLIAERMSRGRRRYHHTTSRVRQLPRWQLRGWRAGLAVLACVLPLILGFVVPAAVLVRRAIRHGDIHWQETVGNLAFNSFQVSALAAVIAVTLALVVVYSARLVPTWLTFASRRVSGLGYAIPGVVIAVAIIIPLGWLDNFLVDVMRERMGWDVGLFLIGSIGAVVAAYVIRFMAVALGTLDAGLGRIAPSLDHAGRTLGAPPRRVLWSVHVPLMRGAVFTGLLLIFVDAMKELPATMILRPADFNTLAVRVHQLAKLEDLGQAAFPALMILAVGLLPVIVLSRLIATARSVEGVS
ncbi:MAG: iron ABC transporter permease [Planctomycetota bacterium]|nr:MAG: iron ABC transporter permease [Planctomycetota bacterium]